MAFDESLSASAPPLTQLEDFLKQAASPEHSPVTLTVRDLLGHWGQTRRTPESVEMVQTDLARHGLTTSPPFTEVWAESEVQLVPAPPREPTAPEESTTEGALRIWHLRGASQDVERAEETDPLTKAITIMTSKDYSQLAVVDGSGNLTGAISERSITRAALRKQLDTVADARESIRHLKPDSLVLDLVDELCTNGFGIVAGDNGKPSGIVTVGDLLQEFVSLHSPILIISTIELRVRKRTIECLDSKVIERYLPAWARRKRDAAPTLGKYRDMLKDEQNWRNLGWNSDHEYFLRMMRVVNETRNELAHFSPDPPNEERLGEIHNFARVLQELT
jgi:restriction system protein